MKLRVKKRDLQEIVNHCRREYPYEACGILAGRKGMVEKVYPLKNVSKTPQTCYFVKPEEQWKVFQEMRKLNLEFVGVYHSHINASASPSARDIKLAFYPEASYLIISLTGGEVAEIKSFKIRGKKFSEERLEIVKGNN